MKVQVNLSDEMVSRIDFYAKKMGVSRSAFCSVVIGQAVFGYDTAYNSLSDYLSDMQKDFDSSSLGPLGPIRTGRPGRPSRSARSSSD